MRAKARAIRPAATHIAVPVSPDVECHHEGDDPGHGDDRFSFGIDMLIAGFAAQISS